MTSRGERGIVLIAVLLAVAIMSVMVVAVTTLTRTGISAERLEERLLASRLALRSGLEIAKAVIAATPKDGRALFDGTPREVDLGQGLRARIIIRDAAGLADINRADTKLLAAVLAGTLNADVAKALSAGIEDLRQKTEGGPERKAGADGPTTGTKEAAPAGIVRADVDGAGAEEKSKPLPAVFPTLDQMLALAPPEAVSPEEAQALGTRLTVFSPGPKVNPLAASQDLLGVIPGLTPQDIAAIDEARKNRAWKDNNRLRQILERLKPLLAVEDPSVFMIGVRLIEGPGVIAQSSASAVVQLLEGQPAPFRTLSVSGL